jgi:hypothetical protein
MAVLNTKSLYICENVYTWRPIRSNIGNDICEEKQKKKKREYIANLSVTKKHIINLFGSCQPVQLQGEYWH